MLDHSGVFDKSPVILKSITVVGQTCPTYKPILQKK